MRSGFSKPGAITLVLCTLLMQACVSTGISDKNSVKASEANALLGANYLQRGELEQARDRLERALEQNPRNAVAHVNYGKLQYLVQNPQKARTHFQKAIEIDPEEADHHNNYGVFLCQIKEYDAAEAAFAKAFNNPYYTTKEFALDNAGVCMLEANRLADADNYLRKALQTNPKFANAYLHMAELLYKRQRLAVAEAYFQRYVSYGRDTAESLFLGMQIRRDSGDRAGAELYASRLLNEFPTSKEAGEYLSGTTR